MQVIVDPWTALQLPKPLLTWAVGADAKPLVGNPCTVKTTWLAGSVPLGLELVMSKVNWTWFPAAIAG